MFGGGGAAVSTEQREGDPQACPDLSVEVELGGGQGPAVFTDEDQSNSEFLQITEKVRPVNWEVLCLSGRQN